MGGENPGAARPCGAGSPPQDSSRFSESARIPLTEVKLAASRRAIARLSDHPLCYRRVVTDDRAQATVYEVLCPHCSKSFREELLTGPAERYHGFKCPHCRLFVPFDRVAEQDETTAD
jgi:hypothetical protein